MRDSSGAVVPSAKVVISTAAQGEIRSITTNSAGAFSAPALLPGAGYKVVVTAPGFGTYEARDLELQVGQNVNLTVSMSVGQTLTTVEVNAAAELLEDTKTDVSQVVGTRDIMNLPINGRRVDAFVLNTPGVTNDATFGLLTFRGVAGNNSFLLDGNDNTEQFYDENAGRTRIYSQISADAVQEFEAVSTNFSAEYGRAMGGVVNTVTKSGSNAIHGGAFFFLRSTGFDAHDPFSAYNPTEHRDQIGGTVGGAIIKNKLFYFLSTDITRRNFPIVDSLVKAGFVNTSAQTRSGAGRPRRPLSARPLTRCCRDSSARFREPPTTTSISAVSTIVSTITIPSARASISCAGCRRRVCKLVFPPPAARDLRATETTPFRCGTARPPGPGCRMEAGSTPSAMAWIRTGKRTPTMR